MTVPDLPALPQVPAVGNPCRDLGCSACCHDVEMLLTDADVARIAAARPGIDFHFQADDGYLQLRTRHGRPAAGAHAAPGAAPRPCIFLASDGACTIHAVRPEGCRLYPAVWDDALRGAELDADYCPHTDRFILDDATTAAVRSLAGRLHQERRARLPRGASDSF
jgi:hypothetical protein